MLIAEVLKLVFEDLEKEVMSTSKSRNQHPQKHLKRLNDWNSLNFDAKPAILDVSNSPGYAFASYDGNQF